MPKTHALNRTTEDYLKAICLLEDGSTPVSTSALAQRLGITSASITEMLKTLSSKGLVRYERYRGVALTRAGRSLALKTVRRHRLWEMYLVKFLGYTWDTIHEEAERLEHATSDILEMRLDHALGYPRIDPHGDPIPTADGVVRGGVEKTLAESGPGTVTVLRVSSVDPALLKYAAELGIAIHRTIRIRRTMPVDGSLRVLIGGRTVFVSAVLARHVFVTEGAAGRRNSR